MALVLKKPDTFGAFASLLCMIHCIATPFLFITHSCVLGGCEATPIWWRSIDYLFLVISFIAIYYSAKTTSNTFIKCALWISWTALLIVILNEKAHWISLPNYTLYIPAITLTALHIYNLKYCQCKTDKCCTNYE